MSEKPTYEELERRIRKFEREEAEHKGIAKILRESDRKMKSIFRAAPVGIGVVIHRVFQDVNDRFCEITGYTRDELIGQSSRIIYPTDEDYENVGARKYEEIHKKGTGAVDTRFKRKDGKIIDVLLSSTPIDPADLSIGVTFTALDITERIQYEKNQMLMARMLDEAPTYVAIHGIDGRCFFANRSAYKMHGYTREDFMSRRIKDLCVPENRRIKECHIQRIKRDGEARFESVHRRKDGSTFPVEVHAKEIDWQGQRAVLSICNDLTDRKREEQYNRMLVEMLDVAPNSITIHDTEGRFLYANRKTFELHGYDKDEFMKLNLHEIDEPESEKLIRERIKTIIDKGEASFTVGHFRKDGSIIPMNVFVKTVEWDGGPAFLSIATDISENQRAEQKRKLLEEQLRQAQKMEAVGRLAGGVAHDFNNMLSLIIGHADMALENMEPGKPLYEGLTEIKRAGERSADLTRQLLAFARKQTIAPRMLDLNEIVEGMLKMLQRLIGEDIELIWIPSKDLWPVKVDPSQVDQIMANLCVNARDAISDVGKITIETNNIVFDESYSSDHTGLKPGEYAQLTVSDNGHGMDNETIGSIFEPFFTTKAVGEGTGLGLSTVYGIVKQNNGFINVYSEPDQGTTIKIYLPRHATAMAALSERNMTQSVQPGHETILIVEDEPSILNMVKIMLEVMGYTVAAASTPGEAIRIAREFAGDIDLLLADVVMPEMNGRDLAEKISSLYPNLKRLFMSGYTASAIAHHGILDEGVNFIKKPFSRKELGARIREVLDADKNGN